MNQQEHNISYYLAVPMSMRTMIITNNVHAFKLGVASGDRTSTAMKYECNC